MKPPRRGPGASAGRLLVSMLCALAFATPALADNVYWVNPSGGSALTATNWFDTYNSTVHSPGNFDVADFNLPNAYTVSWAAPIDTIYALGILAGFPRFNINGSLFTYSDTFVGADSLTLLSGTLNTQYTLVGYNGPASMLVTGGSLITCVDSTAGSIWGRGHPTHVNFFGGGRLSSNGYIELAHSLGDVETTSVAGRAPPPLLATSGIATQSAIGGGYRGDMIVGSNGSACVNLFNGGYATLAGDLFAGKGGEATGMVHLFQTGIGLPSLTVHGQTVLGNSDPVPGGGTVGWGEIFAEKGSVNLMGPCLIQNGDITVRNGASLAATDMTVEPTPNDYSAALLVKGTGSSATITSSLQVGNGSASPSLVNVGLVADSNATFHYTGTSPFTVYTDGQMFVGNGASLVSNAEIDCAGFGQVNSLLQAPKLHIMYSGGISEFDTYSNAVVQARIALDLGASLRTNGTGFLMTVGDSTAPDGFASTGYTSIAQDTLLVLNKGPAELGSVALGGELRVPEGGHLAAGEYLYGFGGQVRGDILNEGTIDVISPNTIAFLGHLTQLTGLAIGTGTISIPNGSTLSAHGSIDPLIVLGGSMDFGPSPALLSAGHGFQAGGTAITQMRIGSKASGIQDGLFVTGTATLGGKLAVASVLGNIPNAGDTITVLTAGLVSGTFSSVTYNGGDPTNAIKLIYSPTALKIVVINGALAVQDNPGLPLRFASAGTLNSPAVALDLPAEASVKVALYDVAGRQMAVLASGTLAPGRHQLPLASAGVSSGIYFSRAEVTGLGSPKALSARVVVLR